MLLNNVLHALKSVACMRLYASIARQLIFRQMYLLKDSCKRNETIFFLILKALSFYRIFVGSQ